MMPLTVHFKFYMYVITGVNLKAHLTLKQVMLCTKILHVFTSKFKIVEI